METMFNIISMAVAMFVAMYIDRVKRISTRLYAWLRLKRPFHRLLLLMVLVTALSFVATVLAVLFFPENVYIEGIWRSTAMGLILGLLLPTMWDREDEDSKKH